MKERDSRPDAPQGGAYLSPALALLPWERGIHRPALGKPVMATWDIRSRKRPFGLSLPASFSRSDGTQPLVQEGDHSLLSEKTPGGAAIGHGG
jgi:hypothetical protein